jgi:ornithine carbamoyltransferase
VSRHLISLLDLDPSDIEHLVNRSVHFSSAASLRSKPLLDRVVAVYFRKTSTRTRTSFSVAALKLGASIVAYGPEDLQTNTGETIEDTARVLSGYVDALVARTAEAEAELRMYAGQNRMAVINAMSIEEHPTQAIADLATLQDHFGNLPGLHILYLGEGNNTAAALAAAVGKTRGVALTLLTPSGYGLSGAYLDAAREAADRCGSVIRQFHSLDHLPDAADVVYTTRWRTTGSTKQDPDWQSHFAPFAVTSKLMESVSGPNTVFLHDLPAVRGEDVDASVLDGAQSLAFRQARFKLYSAMAVLEWCVVGDGQA